MAVLIRALVPLFVSNLFAVLVFSTYANAQSLPVLEETNTCPDLLVDPTARLNADLGAAIELAKELKAKREKDSYLAGELQQLSQALASLQFRSNRGSTSGISDLVVEGFSLARAISPTSASPKWQEKVEVLGPPERLASFSANSQNGIREIWRTKIKSYLSANGEVVSSRTISGTILNVVVDKEDMRYANMPKNLEFRIEPSEINSRSSKLLIFKRMTRMLARMSQSQMPDNANYRYIAMSFVMLEGPNYQHKSLTTEDYGSVPMQGLAELNLTTEDLLAVTRYFLTGSESHYAVGRVGNGDKRRR